WPSGCGSWRAGRVSAPTSNPSGCRRWATRMPCTPVSGWRSSSCRNTFAKSRRSSPKVSRAAPGSTPTKRRGPMCENFWSDAEVISSYSRAQAIEDGVLVDVSEVAGQAGITFPVALTRAVWAKYVEVPAGVKCQDVAGRLWDVLWMLRMAIRRSSGGSEIRYSLHVRNTNRAGTPPLVQLKALCGPGDDGEPVITVMLPEED